jgi:2-C-methyl-D-erythritol 4-phosphate cytidylyltransferase / 2-C-methyl-D-erythritol 2,4-cyclodiphosphate synthase
MPGCIALVVAAGRGQRFGGGMPKQYRLLGGEPVLRHSLRAFAAHAGVDAVRAVIHPDDRDLYDRAAAGLDLLTPVHGGETRQDSVRLGLESLSTAAPDRVLIHDAARPFIDEGIIARAIGALDSFEGALPAVPVSDTLKRGEDGRVAATVERAGLWRAQTPQGFRYAAILAAHGHFAGQELTDDAAVAERAGLAVALVEGTEENFKVTTNDDLERAERLLAAGDVRTGMGFDVHRFGSGDRVMLCGVPVPCDGGLEGHSDADVGLHALTDALLGAIAAGDIGGHFPPGDDRWRGASSDIFLGRAGELVAERGGVVANVDVTVICERPKVAPYRDEMVARIAGILHIPLDRVSIKGTTTERLGFTGRGEGIAAQAVATVRFGRQSG